MSEEKVIEEKADYLAASNGTQTASILADLAKSRFAITPPTTSLRK